MTAEGNCVLREWYAGMHLTLLWPLKGMGCFENNVRDRF